MSQQGRIYAWIANTWRRLSDDPLHNVRRFIFALIGAGASFLSALLGSVGPLMAPFFLAFGLVKGAYIGTEALATVVMHVAKLVAYQRSAVLPLHAVLAGLAIGPIMIFGSFLGKAIVDRLPEKVFVWIIEATLLIAGALFIWKG